ncbi:MAG: type II secretion system protein [Myxococcales bacterium]|jgi:prepilin-type N-terminal cleavage/methylation domain-containing protein
MNPFVARRNRQSRGFSLIELGIVIAVIAVLASVVIFGRGFIVAGRVSKTVEATNTIRKAASTFAGLTGGTIVNPVQQANGLRTLRQRQLIPPTTNENDPWCVAACPAGTQDDFSIMAIGLERVVGQNGTGQQNAVSIEINTSGPAQSEDVFNSVLQDPNFVQRAGTTVGGMTCDTSAPTTETVRLCFYL